MLLAQPKGEEELSVKTLQDTFDAIVVPVATPAEAQNSEGAQASNAPAPTTPATAQ